MEGVVCEASLVGLGQDCLTCLSLIGNADRSHTTALREYDSQDSCFSVMGSERLCGHPAESMLAVPNDHCPAVHGTVFCGHSEHTQAGNLDSAFLL